MLRKHKSRFKGFELFAGKIILQFFTPGIINELYTHIIILDFFYNTFFVHKQFIGVVQIELELELVASINGLFGGQHQSDSRSGNVFDGNEPPDFFLVMKIGAGDGDVFSEAPASFLDNRKSVTAGAFAFQLNPFA